MMLKMKEKSLKTDSKFLAFVEEKVKNTIKRRRLFSRNDKVVVAASGGKDSTTLLYILKKLGYKIEAITIDSHIGCYTQENLENLRMTCKKFNVRLHEIHFRNVFGASLCYLRDKIKKSKSCTVCGVLRRYLLNKKARELKAKKLALGHTLDDEAQTMMMNLLKNRPELNARLGPASNTLNDALFVPRVKPLHDVKEEDIVRYSKIMGFPVKYCRCPCAVDGLRFAVRDFLDAQERKNPGIKEHIVKALLKTCGNKKGKQQCSICKNCGEVSSRGFCKACELLALAGMPLKSGKFSLG